MANYDRSVRPSRNAADSLNITFGLALTQIIDVVSARPSPGDAAILHCARPFESRGQKRERERPTRLSFRRSFLSRSQAEVDGARDLPDVN